MVPHLVFAGVVSLLTLDGELPETDGDYVAIEFEVPAGIVEIEVEHSSVASRNILDWGLWGPDGFRGWGGGLEDSAIVGETEATRGYLPGPIEPGTWRVMIGKAAIRESPAAYLLRVTLKDAETQSPRPRAEYDPVVIESTARWYAGDFHVHSYESGDAPATFDQIAALMRERSLDFVALSEHNTVSQLALQAAVQPLIDDFLFIRAVEVTTYGGHGNAFGISEYIDHRVGFEGRTAAEIVTDTVAQGGLFSVNHPTIELGSLCIGCAWAHTDTPWDQVTAIEIHSAAYDATVGIFTPRAIELWDSLLDEGHRIVGIGGSDDHRAGIDLDSTQSPIGSPTTMVFAEELSEAAILAGLAAGRVYVKLRGPGDPDVELTLRGDDGEGTLGDTVIGDPVELEVSVRGGDGLDVIVYRDGLPDEVAAIDSDDWQHTFDLEVAGDGERVRVQIMEGSLPVVITNHILVVAPESSGGCGCRGTTGGGEGNRLWVVLLAVSLLIYRRSSRSSRSRNSRYSANSRSAKRVITQ